MRQEIDHKELVKIFTRITDEEHMEDLLKDLLTPQEFEDLATRWEIVKLVHAGMPQRDIAETLGVAIGTVSRGARELKYGHEGFTRLLELLDESS